MEWWRNAYLGVVVNEGIHPFDVSGSGWADWSLSDGEGLCARDFVPFVPMVS